ncbi:MAG TPA: STAS domain-containing protein [Acidimicrobiia bacterium]|nr:STAS domain-containing protein [Acidimicrobiia bacterium]
MMTEDREEEVRTEPREFGVDVRDGDGEVTVAIEGEVDLYTAPKLREHLDEAIDRGTDRLVVDLTRMDFIDSTGLGVLVGAQKRLREGGGEMTLRNPSRSTHKILEIAGLTQLFTIE